MWIKGNGNCMHRIDKQFWVNKFYEPVCNGKIRKIGSWLKTRVRAS